MWDPKPVVTVIDGAVVVKRALGDTKAQVRTVVIAGVAVVRRALGKTKAQVRTVVAALRVAPMVGMLE